MPYRVTFDGVEYEGTMTDNADNAWIDITLENDVNMTIYSYGTIYIRSKSFVGEHTIKVEQKLLVVHKIDDKYLSTPVYSGEGKQSIRINSTDNTSSGDYSYAEGEGTTASGYASHAEGGNTTASNSYSHAEGCNTTASSYASHAEGGSTVASGYNSHAEGYNTTASGINSHAEGSNTVAFGRSQHVSGEYNVGYAYTSDKTVLNSNTNLGEKNNIYWSNDYILNQDTGEYELIDAVTANSLNETLRYCIVNGTSGKNMYEKAAGVYGQAGTQNYGLYSGAIIYVVKGSGNTQGGLLEIVGNGTSNSARSNAYTLDWNGVGWYQGGLQVGGKAQDDGAKNVLLEGDAIPVPSSATTGQILAVKSVDASGKPTEWEAVEIPAGGAVIASESAPENTSVLWIDTSDDEADNLQAVIDTALAQAKASGEFDGKDGKDGQNGSDYVLTEADKQEIAELAADLVDVPDTYTKTEINAIMGSYITDIDTLIGGDV